MNTEGERPKKDKGFIPALRFHALMRVISSLVFYHLTRDEKVRALRSIRQLLTEDGKLHLADWSKLHDVLMRIAFLGVQLLDGFETTRDRPGAGCVIYGPGAAS